MKKPPFLFLAALLWTSCEKPPSLPKDSSTPKVSVPTATAKPQDLAEQAQQLLEMEGRANFSSALQKFLLALGPDNWREALAALGPLVEADKLSEPQIQDFQQALGPFGKAELLQRYHPDNPLVEQEQLFARYALLGWALHEPAPATAYLAALPDGKTKDSLAWGLFQSLGGDLPSFYECLPESLWPQIAAAEVAQLPDAAAVQAWLEKVNPARKNAAHQAAAVDALEKSTSSEALVTLVERFFTNSGETSPRVLEASLHNLKARSPEAAVVFVSSQATVTPQLVSTLPTLIAAWSERDLSAPGEWLNRSKASPIYDSATAAYVNVLAVHDLPAAIHWAETIQQPELKAQALNRLPPLPPL